MTKKATIVPERDRWCPSGVVVAGSRFWVAAVALSSLLTKWRATPTKQRSPLEYGSDGIVTQCW
jgi:hypothetical protein